MKDSQDSVQRERDEHEAEVDALRAALATQQDELAGIDAVLARRPALDKPTRRENIEHALNEAAKSYRACCQYEVNIRSRDAWLADAQARADAADAALTEAREMARKAMGLSAEDVADVDTVGLVGSLASHLELAEQEIDNRGQREAEAQQRIAQLVTALNSIDVFAMHIEHDKFPGGESARSFATAIRERRRKAALAASPTGTPRCTCWLGTGATFGDSAAREQCAVHGERPTGTG